MHKVLAPIILLLMCVAFTHPASAQRSITYKASDLSLIGEREVEPRNSRVVIDIGKDQGRLEAIALRVRDHSVRLRGLRIVFGDGSSQEVDIYDRIRPDEVTRIIDLRGERRYVKRIEAHVRPRFRRRRIATLEVLAIESGPELRHLATGVIRGRARVIEIPVGLEFGRMSALSIRAVNRSFRIREIDIEFGDGTHQVIRVNRRVPAGSLTEIHKFPRSTSSGTKLRYIKNVTLTLRPTFSRRSGKLELFGEEVPNEINPHVIGTSSVYHDGAPRIVFRLRRHRDRYTGIALHSLDRPLRIRNVEVVFRDHSRKTYSLNRILGQDRTTRTIYFYTNRSDARRIRRVIVNLARTPRRGRARLRLYGEYHKHPTAKAQTVYARGRRDRRDYYDDRNRRDDRYRDRDRYSDRHERNWVLLGSRKASMFSTDRDAFRIGSTKGRFRAVRVTAQERDIRMYGMRIVYGNGEVETVPIYGTLQEGQTSQAFDLKGRHRYIDHIEFRYRTPFNFKGPGKLELWGLQRH